MPNVSEAAKAWLAKGRAVIPIPHGQKAPALRNWPELRITDATLPDYFNGDGNLGLLLGEPSGGLVDVDLDTAEAVAVAPYFLPATFIYGRGNRPASHYLIESPGVSTRKWQHGGKVLLELRSTGCQSLIPPSVHPDGDDYRRETHSQPLVSLAADKLLDALNRIAAATLIARHWPATGRHDLALTLAGALLHAGWNAGDVETFVEACAVAANDDELADRVRAVKDTVKRHQKGKPATGWPRLGELLPPEVVETVRDWLAVEDFPLLTTSPRKAELPALVTVCATDVERKTLEPLWDGVLWLGKPTLLVGDPGKGKSLATLDIAARVTTGRPWPCSDVEREPGTVMLLSAEDDADDTIVPRLDAAGADLSRVHIIAGVRSKHGIDWLALDTHFRAIAEGMARLNPKLLVIDPLSSFMGRADTNHEGESRKVLAGLAELAKQSRTAVLAVRHFRKGAADSAQGRVIGSVAFTAAARAVYGVTPDPDDDTYRLLLCLKCNLAADTFGYRFRISETAVGDPFVVWDATHEYRSAEELLGSGPAGRQRNCDECGEVFEASRRDAKYCSHACRQAAYHRRKSPDVTDTSVGLSVTCHKPRKQEGDKVPHSDLKSRHKTSEAVTARDSTDDSLRLVTDKKTSHQPARVTSDGSSHSVIRQNDEQQRLALADSKYSRLCRNCGGEGCRWCDEQLRAQHYATDD